MFKCHICGSTESKSELVTEIFRIESQFYLVEDIPATVCASCGEEVFSRETTDNIREMLHSKAWPSRSISVEVFAYHPKAS